MSKSSPTPPAAVDPAAVAAAQSASNINTATAQQKLNLINTTGPNGTVNYSASDAPGGYTQTTTLSPAQQALYNQQTGLQSGALNTAQTALGNVNTALNTPLTAPTLQTSLGPQGNISGSVAPSGNIQQSTPGLSGIQSSYGAGGQIQGQVGNNNASGAVNQATDTAWLQAMSRLAPAYQLQGNQLNSKLAAEGLGANSAAYQNQQDIFGRQVNDALNQAAYGAVQTGDTEQNTLYNQALQSGNFANSAQAQGNQQNLQAGEFGNQASLANFQAGLAQQQAQNAAQAQQFGQNATQTQLFNAAQQQQYLQNMGTAQFGNTAQQQNFQNQATSQNQPINQLSALMGLSQVQSPTGIGYTPAAVAGTDVLGANALAAQTAQAAYNSQLQNQSAMFGGLFNLGSAALTAGLG